MISREEIFAHVKAAFCTEPDYPWPQYPRYAVLRHRQGRKWYGLILDVPRSRLGLDGEGQAEIINLRSDCVLDLLIDGTPGILPAYHMNKKNWISVILDGGITHEALYRLIDESHALTRTRSARPRRDGTSRAQ